MFDIVHSLIKKMSVNDAALLLELNHSLRAERLQTQITIVDNGELLVPLPKSLLRWSPHAYQQLGASYASYSPFHLRESVVAALEHAQKILEKELPSHRLIIFDGYRPLSVQQFMVNHTFQTLAGERPLDAQDHDSIMQDVLSFWSVPSHDLTAPPPHSTGAAVDLTIVDADKRPLDMGGEIDDMDTALPNIYASNPAKKEAHANRTLLNGIMAEAGFTRLPHEWWHFSMGDQWAEYITCLNDSTHTPVARYGRYES